MGQGSHPSLECLDLKPTHTPAPFTLHAFQACSCALVHAHTCVSFAVPLQMLSDVILWDLVHISKCPLTLVNLCVGCVHPELCVHLWQFCTVACP